MKKIFILAALLSAATANAQLSVAKPTLWGGKFTIDSIVNKQPGTTTVMLRSVEYNWMQVNKPVLFMSDTLKLGDTVYLKGMDVWSNRWKKPAKKEHVKIVKN